MYSVFQSAFLKALGWSLLDSFWQMGSLWIVYLVVTGNGKKLTANQRHNLAYLSLAAGALWFLTTIMMNILADGNNFVVSSASLGFLTTLSGAVEPLLPYVASVYLGVTLVLMVRLYRQYRLTHLLSTTHLKKADPEIRVFLAQLAGQMGIKKEIRVFISGLVHTPLTIGFWKPVILLPVALVTNLTIKQTESLILHELYHIQRNDFVMNLLLAFADILLFFNPFAKFFKDTIQQEREHRCDDIVVQFRYDATAYAQALLILEQHRTNTASVAMAATGSKKLLLLARVKRLLTGETISAPVSQRLVAFLVSALFIGFMGLYNPAKKLVSLVPAGSVGVNAPLRLSASEAQQQFETPAAAVQNPVRKTFEAVETVPEDEDTEVKIKPGIERSVAGILISETIGDLLTELSAEPNPLFVSRNAAVDFSLNFDAPSADAPAQGTGELHPFIPSRSFEYYRMEDSLAHDNLLKSIPNAPAPAKPEDVQVALDWKLIEKEVEAAALTIDVVKLQEELDKALAQIDWLKLHNNDPKQSLETVERNVRKYKIDIARIAREHRQRIELNRTNNKLPVRADSILPAKRAVTVRKTIVTI